MRLDALGWSERSACPGLAPVSLGDVLQGVNDAIIRANRRINDLPGMAGVDYTDQSGEIMKVAEDLVALIGYVDDLPGDIADRLDQPLFEAFANGPAQAISQIHAGDLETANTLRVTQTTPETNYRPEITSVKESISFDDFFGSSSQEPQIPYFAETFKADYNAWEQHNLDQGVDFDDYLALVLASGEFDHEGYHPVRSFVSSALDFTIVWPIYKSITGHDPITGEDLEAWERAVGAGMAVVDLAALLAVIPSGGASVAGAAVARTVVRELLVNALATGVSLLTYDMAVALDLPPWLATLAAMGVGLGISVAGTRAVIRRLDAAGKPVGDPIEIDLAKPKTPQPEPPPPKGVDPDEPWPGGGLAADVIPGKPPAITDIPSVHPPDPPPPPKLLPEPDPAPITPDKPKTKPRPEPDPTPPKVPEEWVDVSHYNTHPADDFVRVVGVDSTGRLADVADSAADEAAAMAAVNPASNDLVLGPWVPGDPKSYEQVAHAAGATYFDMGQAYDQIYAIVERTVGEKAASEAMWKINQRFLDQQIAQGKTIYFTSDPRLIDDWRATYKEWTYIKARLGGKVELEQVGDYWVVVPL